MDHVETLLYIAIGVIYLISRVLKARKNAPPQQTGRPQQQAPASDTGNQRQPRRTFSFEDILKEFEQNLGGEEYEEPEPVKEVERHQPQPVTAISDERTPSPYEAYEGTSFRSPTSESNVDHLKEIFSRSENYSIREQIASDYARMLQDPEGFKNAIVLSEIINRKYF